MPSLAPPHRLLFGPGPTQVEPRVYEAMTKPIVGYLDPFFFEVVEEIRRDLRVLFGTANPMTDYYDRHKYHHTPPVSTFYALREGLAAIMEEGANQRFSRHQRCHEDFVRRIEAMGLSMHVSPGRRIANLNTVGVPDGVEEVQVRKRLLAAHSIEIAGGFGPLAGKIFRIGVMGPLATGENVELFCDAFAQCLAVPAAA